MDPDSLKLPYRVRRNLYTWELQEKKNKDSNWEDVSNNMFMIYRSHKNFKRIPEEETYSYDYYGIK